MRRIALIGAALIASLAMTTSASARLGTAPIAAQNHSVIQVKHGGGHGDEADAPGTRPPLRWYRGRGHHSHRHHR